MEVLKAWKEGGDVQSDKVILLKNVDGEYIGLSTVDDYMYRPYELSDKSLYEWKHMKDVPNVFLQ